MSFQVEFVSPEDLLYSGQASQVVARTRGGGEIAFLEGHEAFVGSLDTCEVRVSEEGGDIIKFAVRNGFVSVAGEKVTVLSGAAIPAQEIDVAELEDKIADFTSELEDDEENGSLQEELRWAKVQLNTAQAD